MVLQGVKCRSVQGIFREVSWVFSGFQECFRGVSRGFMEFRVQGLSIGFRGDSGVFQEILEGSKVFLRHYTPSSARCCTD